MRAAPTAFGISGLYHHLCRLRALVAEHDVEAFAEAKGFALHQAFLQSFSSKG
jgi:hypothetical protein